MTRSFDDARRWMRLGTEAFIDAVDRLDDTTIDQASLLPDWSRRHVTAHVAANADALGHLVHWAATGEPTPMYASPEDRTEGIERGTALNTTELLTWLTASAGSLEQGMMALDAGHWQTEIRTAQGRTVPATEVPWLRAREVCVHAVDLGAGVQFIDLPADFLLALCDDVVVNRGGLPDAARSGALDQVAAYLTGRPHHLRLPDGTPAPALSAWL